MSDKMPGESQMTLQSAINFMWKLLAYTEIYIIGGKDRIESLKSLQTVQFDSNGDK